MISTIDRVFRGTGRNPRASLMRIDLYSTRAKLASRSGSVDVYQYDQIPKAVRTQLTQVFIAAIGPSKLSDGTFIKAPRYGDSQEMWEGIHQVICREFGRHTLSNCRDSMDDLLSYFEHSATANECLDIVEVVCRVIENWASKLNAYDRERHAISQAADDAIEEVNHRLRRGGVGFQFESGEIVRVDSQMLHQSAVVPALQLLADEQYGTVDEEYRNAHQHYRNDEHEPCLVECLKSLESMLKVICVSKGWAAPPKATVSVLLDIVFKQGLVPPAISGQLTALRATLEQGVPTLRNQLAGHGQGPTTRKVPGAIAAYALHLTASSIILLAELARA